MASKYDDQPIWDPTTPPGQLGELYDPTKELGHWLNPKEGGNMIQDMIDGVKTAPDPQKYMKDLLEEGWIEKKQYDDLMLKYGPKLTS